MPLDSDITDKIDSISYATRNLSVIQGTVNSILDALSSPNANRAMLPDEGGVMVIPAPDGENIDAVVGATRRAAIAVGVAQAPEE